MIVKTGPYFPFRAVLGKNLHREGGLELSAVYRENPGSGLNGKRTIVRVRGIRPVSEDPRYLTAFSLLKTADLIIRHETKI